MTYIEAYRQGLKILNENKISDSNFDNRLIFEKNFNLNRTNLAIDGDKQAPDSKINSYLKDIQRRAKFEPLQYILGSWEFMGNSFEVGEGVLIPREETEIAVNCVVESLGEIDVTNPVIFDLCSGSGCIGISVAKLIPNATVYLIEKSEEALKYLHKNVKINNVMNVRVVHGDIEDNFESFFLPTPDVIVSNPPYIKTQDIESLQNEVKNEPNMALDGGEDGLYFYKTIKNNWSNFLSSQGSIIFEIGENQEDEIQNIFKNSFKLIKKVKDFNNIYRTLILKH